MIFKTTSSIVIASLLGLSIALAENPPVENTASDADVVQEKAEAKPASSRKLKSMYFQADKNHLQVLPQRFEYTLLDQDRLKIGNILIDTTELEFQIIKDENNKKNPYQITFKWPAGLIKEGQLAIKNNSGKAVFSREILPENINVGETVVTDDGLIDEKATITFSDVDASVVEDMKYYPFMTFCIFKESYETRLYLCSRELYINPQEATLTVKARSSNQRNANIDINGKVVGNQGIIYLNDRQENVSFTAHTQSGAFLEIETRMKDVDFKDVVVSPDGRRIILTASGAEPFNNKHTKFISETEWQVVLPRSRPVLYLKGEGDIPMRQEFFVRGVLPKENNRIFLSPRATEKTYSSSLRLVGVTPPNVQATTIPEDTNTSLEKSKGQQFIWTVTDIPSGKSSRHYLLSKTGDEVFTLGYDIYRGRPFVADLDFLYATPSGRAYAGLGMQWWFENLFGIQSDFTRFHWGVGLQYQAQVVKADDYAEADRIQADIYWRAHPGFYMQDSTWGLYMPIEMLQGKDSSLTSFGLGFFYNLRTTGYFWRKWSSVTEMKLHYLPSGSGDVELKSAYRLQWKAYKDISSNWYWSYGLDINDYKFEPAAAKEEMEIGLSLGLRATF